MASPRPSPKVIPRVHLSPKVKQRIMVESIQQPIVVQSTFLQPPAVVRPPTFVQSVLVQPPIVVEEKTKLVPAPSPSRTKSPFLINKNKFRTNPDVNPLSGRTIKRGSHTYKKLVDLYGDPY